MVSKYYYNQSTMPIKNVFLYENLYIFFVNVQRLDLL